MTYEQLRVLQAIVTEGTFRGAAQKLFKTQPAVSNMLKKLESECGFELFSRDQYRPELTPVGKIFYQQTLHALKQMQKLGNLAKELAGEQEADVTIAVHLVCPLDAVLKTLQSVGNEFPHTNIRLATESMSGVIERLKEDEADIVITTQEGVQSDIMEVMHFKTVDIFPVAHKGYEPAKTLQMNSITTMQNYVQVIVADSSRGKDKQSYDVLPSGKRCTVTDVTTKKDIITAGLGWGGLPQHLIQKELDEGLLVPLSVEGFDVRQRPLYLMRRTDKSAGKVAQKLWDSLVSICQ